jgi:hypothetical protein
MIIETRCPAAGCPAHHGGAWQPGFGRCCAPAAGVCAIIEAPVVLSRDDVAEWLDSCLALVRAKDRIDGELRLVALDVVGRCEHDELDPTSKLLLRRVTERAIESTLEPLTVTFAAALERGIDGLPEALRHRLTRAEARRDLGWD